MNLVIHAKDEAYLFPLLIVANLLILEECINMFTSDFLMHFYEYTNCLDCQGQRNEDYLSLVILDTK